VSQFEFQQWVGSVIRSSRRNDAMADLPPGLQAEKQRMLELLHGSDEGLAAKTILLVDDDARNIFALSGQDHGGRS
jgi:hypothetical protein